MCYNVNGVRLHAAHPTYRHPTYSVQYNSHLSHFEIPLSQPSMNDKYEPIGRAGVSSRRYLYSGALLGILVWGVLFLLITISNFHIHPSPAQIEQYLKNAPPPLLYDHRHSKIQGPRLNVSSYRDGLFRPEFTSVQWIHDRTMDGTFVLTHDSSHVIKSIIDESYEYVLFNSTDFVYDGKTYTVEGLTASPDLTKAILRTNVTHNWRHSTFALYWTLDVASQIIEPVYPEPLAVTSWSPKSDAIAFVYQNDVYVKRLNEVTRFTHDGNANVFNGKPDWVYEEEVFSSDIVLWWSPEGDKIAFLKLNDTEVPEYPIQYYVQQDKDYPEVRNIKYPKAGYPNPVVELVVADVNDASSVSNIFLSSLPEYLITEVLWVSDDNVLVKTSNRASDILEIFLVDAAQKTPKKVRQHKAEKSWFEVLTNTRYITKNKAVGRNHDGYIDTVVVDGYNHLAYFSPPDNPHPKILTKGNWEVVGGVKAFDEERNQVYFIGTKKSSVERHLYSVNLLEGESSINEITDTEEEGWYSASISSGSRYLLLTYQGPKVPYQELVDLHTHKHIKYVETNDELKNTLNTHQVPRVEYLVIFLGKDEDGNDIKANAKETFPLNFDSSKQYPVLFYVYGGPGSQMVTKSFSVDFSALAAAELDAIVVTVDGRGTGFNSYGDSNFKFCVRDHLGHYEPIDQIAAAKIWSRKSYVDSSRMAIWGWSYGGFLTLKTLETDAGSVFSYGAAVAPVTKWKLYDSIYTERYMRTPQENPDGYQTASIHNVTQFKDVTRFLIMHGSGDDNVHFQNTLELIDEYNLAAVENFDFMVFPDSDHSISYHNGNNVVYDRLLTWLDRAFSGEFVLL